MYINIIYGDKFLKLVTKQIVYSQHYWQEIDTNGQELGNIDEDYYKNM